MIVIMIFNHLFLHCLIVHNINRPITSVIIMLCDCHVIFPVMVRSYMNSEMMALEASRIIYFWWLCVWWNPSTKRKLYIGNEILPIIRNRTVCGNNMAPIWSISMVIHAISLSQSWLSPIFGFKAYHVLLIIITYMIVKIKRNILIYVAKCWKKEIPPDCFGWDFSLKGKIKFL